MPSLVRTLARVGRRGPAASSEAQSPQEFLPWGAMGRPLWQEWNAERAFRDGYEICSWVFACIDRLAGAVASVPWQVKRRTGEEWEHEADDPIEIAIEYPNDFHSRQFLVTMAVQHLGITGNVLWKTVRVRGEVNEFWPMSPLLWKPVPHATKWLSHYEAAVPGKVTKERLEPAAVVHSQFPNPLQPLWGVSPLRAIRQTVDMDVRHVAWNRKAVETAMVPTGAFISPEITNEAQMREARKKIHEWWTGPENAKEPLLLGAGGKWERMAMTPAEMDWIESRRFSLIEICAAYGLLPSMFVPESKYANLGESVRYMWENGAARLLSVLEDGLNTRLIPRAERASRWIHFDLSGVTALQDNIAKRLESHERAVRSAVPPNKSFILFDLPVDPVPGGERGYISGALVPLEEEPEKESLPMVPLVPGQPTAPPPAPPPTAAAAEEQPPAAPAAEAA